MSAPEKKKRIDRLFDRIESHGFESLTPGEQASFALTWLFLETNNGGLDQFFFNDAGKLAMHALRGLDMVGASETAGILRRAISIFPEGAVPLAQAERRSFLCDSITEQQEVLLDDLTTQFYRCSEDVAQLLANYIEQHPDEFPT